jgi:hypothetical protein
MFFSKLATRSVARDGATAGTILRGCGLNNHGLRLRVLQDQPRGAVGPITGEFVILDPGDNIHADSLRALQNQGTNAGLVLERIRRKRTGCVSVANASILAVEAG